MPISREEFDQALIDLALPIVQLLARRPDLAFTVEEMHRILLETMYRYSTREEVERVLETLVSQGKVEKKQIDGYQWYTIHIVERRVGFL